MMIDFVHKSREVKQYLVKTKWEGTLPEEGRRWARSLLVKVLSACVNGRCDKGDNHIFFSLCEWKV